MKFSLILLIFLSNNILGQSLTDKQVERYVNEIDAARTSGKLDKYFYPNMSSCSGALYGYYDNGKLVYIQSRYGGELGVYTSQNVYLKDSTIYRIDYKEHFAEWEKFNSDSTNVVDDMPDFSKMTYTDTRWEVVFTPEVQVTQSKDGKKPIKVNDPKLLKRLIDCVSQMRKELVSERLRRE